MSIKIYSLIIYIILILNISNKIICLELLHLNKIKIGYVNLEHSINKTYDKIILDIKIKKGLKQIKLINKIKIKNIQKLDVNKNINIYEIKKTTSNMTNSLKKYENDIKIDISKKMHFILEKIKIKNKLNLIIYMNKITISNSQIHYTKQVINIYNNLYKNKEMNFYE